jgi:Ca2+-binding RTX toxin-like protein
MRLDGADIRQLTSSPALDALPEWSPDGKRIAFVSERSDGRAPFVMDADGSEPAQLAVGGDTTAVPAWQPLPREPLLDTIWAPICTIFGTPADDLLVGTPERDVICGLDGNDRILGGEGGDTIVGGPGDDVIVGGPGGDVVSAGTDDDHVDLRDAERDSVDGGTDTNIALIDAGLDRTSGVQKAFDPDPRNLTRGRPVRASLSLPDRPPELAVDGHVRLIWGALDAPAWIEGDFNGYATVERIQLVVGQAPSGKTRHVVLGLGRDGRWRYLTTFSGDTHDGQVLRYTAPRPWSGIRAIRVVTRESPSWVAWKEIQALGVSG